MVAVARVMVAVAVLRRSLYCGRWEYVYVMSECERLDACLVVYERSERLERLCGEEPHAAGGVRFMFFPKFFVFFCLFIGVECDCFFGDAIIGVVVIKKVR